MHIVKKRVFQLFENLKINITQYILFLIFQVLNIKYLAGIKEEENGNFFNRGHPLMRVEDRLFL